MAKPKKKPEAGTSTTTLTIELTATERQQLEHAAKEAGMPVDAFVKSRTLPPPSEKPFTPIPPDIWHGLFPDDLDLDKDLHEIRTEWEKEWDEHGNFVG